MEETTLRKELTELGFDWENGEILYQQTSGYSPGWSHGIGDAVSVGAFIAKDDPILDEEYEEGYGAPQCPRFIAKDRKALYFPAQFDGSTWVERVYLNISEYKSIETPYPGG